MQYYKNTERWTQNVKTYQTPENQNKYFAFVYPPNPTPTDETFFQLQSKILAPITGSVNIIQNVDYQIWNTKSGMA